MKRLLIISITLFAGSICLAQDGGHLTGIRSVEFVKEEITLTVSENTFTVSGTYYFRNNSNSSRPFTVQFPFYVDSLALYPDTIAVATFSNDAWEVLKYTPLKSGNSIAFAIPLAACDETAWRIDYTQRIMATHARYILTSTAAWNKPLKEATYRFIVPSAFGGIRVWPEADTVLQHDRDFEFISHKTNFMPPQDMEVWWDTPN